jgi:Na+/glutamate symporter
MVCSSVSFVGFCIGLAIFLDLYIAIIVFIIGTFFHPTYWVPQLQELHLARNLAFGILLIWGFHIIIYRDFKIEKAPQNILIAVFFTIGFLSTLKDFDYSFRSFGSQLKGFGHLFHYREPCKIEKQLLFLVWFS